MAILYSALADQVSLSAMAWGVVPNGEQKQGVKRPIYSYKIL